MLFWGHLQASHLNLSFLFITSFSLLIFLSTPLSENMGMVFKNLSFFQLLIFHPESFSIFISASLRGNMGAIFQKTFNFQLVLSFSPYHIFCLTYCIEKTIAQCGGIYGLPGFEIRLCRFANSVSDSRGHRNFRHRQNT